MKADRRTFLTTGVASLCALGATDLASGGGGGAESQKKTDGKSVASGSGLPSCLDYAYSFICNPADFNEVRFWVESRTTLIDAEKDRVIEFYQCASCKSENTFGEKDLFYQDNYDFLPILGDGDWLVFRRPARLSSNYRQVKKAEDIWGKPILKLRTAKRVTLLESWEEIREATAAAIPIVSQTEITDEKTGLKAVIECPVKTMNVSVELKKYQVDTGPLAYPDLSKRFERSIECLSLAFVAFNAPHFADFVVEQPTPVTVGGREVTKIHHYSNPFSLPAKNRLLAVHVD